MQQRAPAVALEVSSASRELAERLAALAAPQRQPHVESLVVRVVRELTGSEASVTASTPLMEAGVDSLAATELSNRLCAATGLALSPTLVFEQPTPRAIAAHVVEQLAGAQPVVALASLASVRRWRRRRGLWRITRSGRSSRARCWRPGGSPPFCRSAPRPPDSPPSK